MSTLRDRIQGLGQVQPDVTVIAKDYGNVKAQPTVRIQIYPDLIAYSTTQPLIAPDGGIIYATGPGTWGQLYAVGRQ